MRTSLDVFWSLINSSYIINMKKIFLKLVFLFSTGIIIAQTPQAFKYQAIARDKAGNVLSNWEIGMRVSIIEGGHDGQAVYIETHQITSNIYGMINLVIGKGNVQKGAFNSISWGQSSHSIKIELDIDGGSNYKETGTSQLYAVPYALYAEQAGAILEQNTNKLTNHQQSSSKRPQSNSGNRTGTPNSKFPADTSSYLNVNVGNVGIGTTDPQEKLDVNGNVKTNHLVLTDTNGVVWNFSAGPFGEQISTPQYPGDMNCGTSMVDERDGQVYPIVQIGIQCWLAKNMNIGDRIDGSENQTDNGTIEKYCYNNVEDSCDIYGGLYQWDEAMQYSNDEGVQGICPTGWHVPSEYDWNILIGYLGGEDIAGGKLKEADTIHWDPPNVGATNESGFTALPGGIRLYNGGFVNLGYDACFWSSMEINGSHAWRRHLYYNHDEVTRYGYDKTLGFSARCLKD